jgi:hypothetical protein
MFLIHLNSPQFGRSGAGFTWTYPDSAGLSLTGGCKVGQASSLSLDKSITTHNLIQRPDLVGFSSIPPALDLGLQALDLFPWTQPDSPGPQAEVGTGFQLVIHHCICNKANPHFDSKVGLGWIRLDSADFGPWALGFLAQSPEPICCHVKDQRPATNHPPSGHRPKSAV